MSSAAEGTSALGCYLNARGLLTGPVTASRVGDGHSNLTYLVDDGTRSVVVRRPPPPPLPVGAHDVRREARVLAALRPAGVPVPEVYAVADAGEVFDVPCFVMSYVAGPVVSSTTPLEWDTPARRRTAGFSLVDTLAAIHAVDWRAVGLDDFGRPDGFNERHFRRLSTLLARPGEQTPAGFDEIAKWLAANVPVESDAAVVHGDYRLGNVLYRADGVPEVAAVLDWELSTIGDPLLDVAFLLASWPSRDEPSTPVQDFAGAALDDGWPTRDELADHYASVSGRNLADLRWYSTLVGWKLAVLYEYSRRRAETGDGDAYYLDPAMVPAFLAAARREAGLD